MKLSKMIQIASGGKDDVTMGELSEIFRLTANLALALELGPKAKRHFSDKDMAEIEEMRLAYDGETTTGIVTEIATAQAEGAVETPKKKK